MIVGDYGGPGEKLREGGVGGESGTVAGAGGGTRVVAVEVPGDDTGTGATL